MAMPFQLVAESADIRHVDHEVAGELALERDVRMMHVRRRHLQVVVDEVQRQRIERAVEPWIRGRRYTPEVTGNRNTRGRHCAIERPKWILDASLEQLYRAGPRRLGGVHRRSGDVVVVNPVSGTH